MTIQYIHNDSAVMLFDKVEIFLSHIFISELFISSCIYNVTYNENVLYKQNR
jgi:hypothetical protein